jgi:hypothetical protein
LHAVEIPNLKVHCQLTQFLTDLDDGRLCFPQLGIVADNRDTTALITIKARILWVKPLSLGDSLVRTAFELLDQSINDAIHLLRGHFAAAPIRIGMSVVNFMKPLGIISNLPEAPRVGLESPTYVNRRR